MSVTQSVVHPHGVAVLGTATLRVSPDHAHVRCAVVRAHDAPTSAFAAARDAARAVRTFLDGASVDDVQSSRVSLKEHYAINPDTRRRERQGYAAQLEFHLVVRELDTLESVLVGILEHGVNELRSTEFGTSELAALRRRARAEAVAAARAKAELYADTAGCRLGRVLHIEDVNPQLLRGRESAHIKVESAMEDDRRATAVDPGAIVVGAAVHITFGWAD